MLSMMPFFAREREIKDRFTIHKSKFFYLLLSLIIYFISAAIMDTTNSGFQLSIFFTLIILSCIYVIAHNRLLVFSTLTIGSVVVTCHWLILLYTPYDVIYLVCYLGNVSFLAILMITVLYSVTQHTEITADTLFGAICGYFLIGFTWTYIDILISWINPLAFNHMLSGSIHDNVQHFLYFSFTTMTTLGYGDILPMSNFARTCAWLEAIAGQTYLAVWISQLVGLQIIQKTQIRDKK